MAQQPQLALSNDPNQNIWSYYKVLWINPIGLDDHLVVILEISLIDKSIIMNMYNIYNLPI